MISEGCPMTTCHFRQHFTLNREVCPRYAAGFTMYINQNTGSSSEDHFSVFRDVPYSQLFVHHRCQMDGRS